MADISVGGVVDGASGVGGWLAGKAEGIFGRVWPSIEPYAPWVGWGLYAILWAVLGMYSWRWFEESRQIPLRYQMAALPSTEYQPTEEQMLQASAAWLANVHKATWGFLRRRITFVRVEHGPNSDVEVTTWVTAPGWATGAVHSGLGVDADLSLRPSSEVDVLPYVMQEPPRRLAVASRLARLIGRGKDAAEDQADELVDDGEPTEEPPRNEEGDVEVAPALPDATGTADGGWSPDELVVDPEAAGVLPGKGAEKTPADVTEGDGDGEASSDGSAPAGPGTADPLSLVKSMPTAALDDDFRRMMGTVFAEDAPGAAAVPAGGEPPEDLDPEFITRAPDKPMGGVDTIPPLPPCRLPAMSFAQDSEHRLDQVQIRKGRGKHTVRREVKLSGPIVGGLVPWHVNPDPKGLLAAVMSRLDPSMHEDVRIFVDVRPVPAGARKRLLKKVTKAWAKAGGSPASRDTANAFMGNLFGVGDSTRPAKPAPGLLAGWNGINAAGPRPAASSVRTDDEESARVHKLADLTEVRLLLLGGEPLFEVSAFVIAHSDIRGRAVRLANDAQVVLTTSNKTAHMATRGVRIPLGGGRNIDLTGFLGSNNWFWRGWIDHRLESQLFHPAKMERPLRASEIAPWIFPTMKSAGDASVCRTGGRIPSAPVTRLVEYRRQLGVLPLGDVATAKGLKFVGVPAADMQFRYCPGQQGRGKTASSLVEWAHMSLVEGHCTVMLDPQVHAIELVKDFLSDVADRVIVLTPGQDGPQASWNPLDMRGCDEQEYNWRVGSLLVGIEGSLGWGSGRNNRALAILSLAFYSLAHISYLMCQAGRPEDQPTIFSIKPLLLDKDWRAKLVPLLPAHLQKAWQQEFKNYGAEAVQVVINLISRLRNRRATAALFGQSLSSYRFAEALREHKIVLLSPEGLGDLSALVATMLMSDLFDIIGRRSAAEAAAAPVYVLADECQIYDKYLGPLLGNAVRTGRKMHLRMSAANQELAALSDETLSALFTNASQVWAFATDKRSAVRLSDEMLGAVAPRVIQALPKYRAIVRVEVGGNRLPPFEVRTKQIKDAFADCYKPEAKDRLEEAITAAMGRQDPAVVWDALGQHDEAVVRAITETLVLSVVNGRPGRPRKDGSV